jgi:2-polyprenyl-3-methyl-5-hydroxy-6-metoxy-1,4-benzoquinol methylase
MKKVYDAVYENIVDYDGIFSWKIHEVNKIFDRFDKSINVIDVGCGKGHYLRNLIGNGFKNVLGVEFSSVCSENYLTDVPHINEDFLIHSTLIKDKEYKICLCMDVLEHIDSQNLDEFLIAISRISNHAVLGIANHSDIFLGEELHLIQENSKWWEEKLQNNFLLVEKKFELENGRFFLFECHSQNE